MRRAPTTDVLPAVPKPIVLPDLDADLPFAQLEEIHLGIDDRLTDLSSRIASRVSPRARPSAVYSSAIDTACDRLSGNFRFMLQLHPGADPVKYAYPKNPPVAVLSQSNRTELALSIKVQQDQVAQLRLKVDDETRKREELLRSIHED